VKTKPSQFSYKLRDRGTVIMEYSGNLAEGIQLALYQLNQEQRTQLMLALEKVDQKLRESEQLAAREKEQANEA
jgi:uncharacterized membrane protein